jgi:hypothetical protein
MSLRYKKVHKLLSYFRAGHHTTGLIFAVYRPIFASLPAGRPAGLKAAKGNN